jgi:hypothetical protein
MRELVIALLAEEMSYKYNLSDLANMSDQELLNLYVLAVS